MPRVGWLAVFVLAAGLAPPVAAQPLGPLEPVAPFPPPAPAPSGGPVLGSTPVTPYTPVQSTSHYQPPPILGAPVGVGEPAVTPSRFVDEPVARTPQKAASLGAPRAIGSPGVPAAVPSPVSADLVEAAPNRTAFQPPASDPVNDFLNGRSDLRVRKDSKDREPNKDKSGWPKWVSKAPEMGFNEMVGARNGGWFRSDHMFDGFISPVTNPFLFEDPRSLTEVRPIFIYQRLPSSQRDFFGGHISFFGAQGRVAITDRWSFVFNKFGGIAVNPGDRSTFGDETGFAELWMGPKWTFYRGEENGILGAAGLQFQLPVGSASTFQDTGTLSLVPYVSYAQNFLRDFRWGSFNLMASTGYTFSVNKERSDYYWLSAHLDFDIGNYHRFYPLFEMNWFLVTSNGNSRPIGAEGRDLINFGGQASGTGLLTGAFGGRVKITESAQLGAAFEIPFAGKKDLFQYRFTIDFILRY